MANTFIHRHAAVTASWADVYTPAASTTAIIFSLVVANIDGANSADISIRLEDSDAGATYTALYETIPVPPDAALNHPGKVVLEAGESIQVLASVASDLVIQLSILEIT